MANGIDFGLLLRQPPILQGCRNGRFGKRSFCPLPKTGGFDENWRKFWYCILPTKTRDFAPQTPEIDENDENGGCHPSKMTVCQKHRFDNPEYWAVFQGRPIKTFGDTRPVKGGDNGPLRGGENGLLRLMGCCLGTPPSWKTAPSTQRTLPYKKCYEIYSKNSELPRRSVFATPPRFTTPRTLLGEGKCL